MTPKTQTDRATEFINIATLELDLLYRGYNRTAIDIIVEAVNSFDALKDKNAQLLAVLKVALYRLDIANGERRPKQGEFMTSDIEDAIASAEQLSAITK